MSSRFKSEDMEGGLLVVRSILLSGSARDVALDNVSGLMVPRNASGLRLSSRVPEGWIGSNSSVASLPASWRIIWAPPGCFWRKSVTYHNFPVTMTLVSIRKHRIIYDTLSSKHQIAIKAEDGSNEVDVW